MTFRPFVYTAKKWNECKKVSLTRTRQKQVYDNSYHRSSSIFFHGDGRRRRLLENWLLLLQEEGEKSKKKFFVVHAKNCAVFLYSSLS